MHPQSSRRVRGNVTLKRKREGRRREDTWFARVYAWEVREGGSYGEVERTVKLGPAHPGKGRPPAGYFNESTAKMELGSLLAAEHDRVGTARLDVVTFGQAADEWLRYSEFENECAHATMGDYRRTVAVLNTALGIDTPLTAITSMDVEQLKTDAKASGLSARTVNRRLVILGGVFRRVDAKWGIGHNPASGQAVKRLREQWSGSAIRFYRPEEIHALVGATTDPTYEALFLTAALTGLRLGELRALRWRDVDLMSQRVHVERSFCGVSGKEKAPKSGKARSVPLALEVQQVLARLRDVTGFDGDGDLVFPAWDGAHLNYQELSVTYKAAQRRAKLAPIRFHDLRHTFGTMCAQAGMPLTTIQAFMGHASVTTTMIYAHFTPAGDEAAKISAAFTAATVSTAAPAEQAA